MCLRRKGISYKYQKNSSPHKNVKNRLMLDKENNLKQQFAVSTLYEWFKNNKDNFIAKEVKLEFKDTGRGSACVSLDTETYITELCAWDNASCLDIQIIEIKSEESTYPHTGECESLAIFEKNLKEYLKWFESVS